MDFPELLDLPTHEARILRYCWYALPWLILLDCAAMITCAVAFRHDRAAFSRFLAIGATVSTLAFWFVVVPLVTWTATLRYRTRHHG